MESTALHYLQTCPESVRKCIREAYFQTGEMIMTQGDPPEHAFILVEGEAGVYQMTMNGIVYQAYIYTDEELFGEIEVLNGQPVVSNIRANRLSKALRIPKAAFIEWLRTDREFMLFVCRQLADKLYTSSIHSVTNIAYPLKYRLLYYLWNAHQQGNPYVRKEDIITGLGSNERSINRILKDLIESSLVAYDQGVVKVISPPRILEAMGTYE